MFGGALGPSPGGYVAVPFSTLTTVDAAGHVTNEMTGNLNEARWSPAGIPLPDGTVLAMAGARNSHTASAGLRHPRPLGGDLRPGHREVDEGGVVNPGPFLPLQRHPPGRRPGPGRRMAAPIGTLFGPHRTVGGPFANNNRDSSFEIYSPPYLFRGPRPKISRRPGRASPGARPSSVETAGRLRHQVGRARQARRPSSTPWTATAAASSSPSAGPVADRLEVVAPPGGTVAPPGAYYLFVNRQNAGGLTPSVARIVFVGDHHDDAEAFQPFPDDFAGVTGGSATDPDRRPPGRGHVPRAGRHGGQGRVLDRAARSGSGGRGDGRPVRPCRRAQP